jgi:hypothetical protein
MTTRYRGLAIVVLLLILGGLCVQYAVTDHWSYPSADEIAAEPQTYEGATVFLFGEIESIDPDRGTVLLVTGEDPEVRFTVEDAPPSVTDSLEAGASIQVYGSLRDEASVVVAEEIVVDYRHTMDRLYVYVTSILGGVLAGAFLAVRTTGVALELAYPGVPPKAIAAPLYLVIAVGLPALVAVGARRPDPAAAFLGVTAGLGAGFVLDFAALGVAVPPGLIVHRTAVLVALGLLAAGRAAEDRSVLVSGVIAWLVGLFPPIAGVI